MLQKLGIEQGEGRVFAWGAAALFLIGWAEVSVKNVAETLFIKRVGVEYMPLAFLGSAILLVGTTYIAVELASRSDRLRLLPRVLVGLGLALLPIWLLVVANFQASFWLLIIASKQMQSVALLVFWVALSDLLHGRQSKRLLAPLMAGLTLGNILGSFASEPISRLAGISGLLPVSACALALGASVALPLRGLRSSRLERGSERGQRGVDDDDGRGEHASTAGFGALWRDSRLFRLVFISAACSGLVGPMLYIQFSYVADIATQGAAEEERLMAFYAQFRGWIYVLVLFAQVGVTANLYRRIGVPLATAISPLMYLLGFVGLSVRFSLPAGIGAMAGTKLQDSAVYDPAVRVLFNLFPEEIRARAMVLLEGPVKRAGGAVGNVVTFAAVSLGSAAVVGYAALPFTAVWLASVLLLWRAYPSLLLQASATRSRLGDDFDASEMLDANTLRSLAAHLRDPDPARCGIAVDLVSDARPELATGVLAEAAREAPDATRPLLVAALDRVLERSAGSETADAEAAAHLQAMLEEPDRLGERDRADVVQAYGRVSQRASRGLADSVLTRAVHDPSPAVRLTAAAALCRLGTPPSPDFDLDRALVGAIAAADPVLRRAAREEYRAMLLRDEPDETWRLRLRHLARLLETESDRAEAAMAIADVARRHGDAVAIVTDDMLRWREDPDVETRVAILGFIGAAGLEEHSAWLVSHARMDGAGEAERLWVAARGGLQSLGQRAVDALLVELSFGKRSAQEAILPLLRALDVDRGALRELYERELDSIRHKLVTLHAAVGAGVSPMLLQRLGERLDEGMHTALQLLAAIHDDDRIANLAAPLRRERGGRQHAILLEALEALLSPVEKAQLMPLVEDRTAGERARAAARALRIEIPSPESTARALLDDPDAVTQRIAVATLRAAGVEGLATDADVEDDGDVLSPVERALMLKRIPLFEELTTRQLLNLAELVNQEEHPPGTPICRIGDFSDCMYFIVDGTVDITTASDASLAQLGPNDFFGEIAVFEGATRSANATTGEEAVRLLRLGRDDLLKLMEELPGIAICICQTLSRRVRDLTTRLTV